MTSALWLNLILLLLDKGIIDIICPMWWHISRESKSLNTNRTYYGFLWKWAVPQNPMVYHQYGDGPKTSYYNILNEILYICWGIKWNKHPSKFHQHPAKTCQNLAQIATGSPPGHFFVPPCMAGTGACAAFVMAKEWKFEAHDSNDGRYWAYTYLIIFDGFLK